MGAEEVQQRQRRFLIGVVQVLLRLFSSKEVKQRFRSEVLRFSRGAEV